MAVQSDIELVRACRDGNEQAWETLIQRYQRLVYSIPRRAGLDEDTAADVFQKVFATLFEHLDDLERPDRLGAWLVTVARRESLRLVRQAAATRSFASANDEQAAQVADESPLAEDILMRIEEQHALRRAVDALPPRCRELVDLLFFEPQPMSYAEVAARLGVPEGSIGPTRGRCLERLGHTLAETAPEVFPQRKPDSGPSDRRAPLRVLAVGVEADRMLARL